MDKRINLLFLFSILIFGALISLLFIRPATWDWFGYHYYNGWAFLNNRFDIDIMPNFHRTYFNPLLDGFTYLFVKGLNNHPYIFLIITSLKYSLFLFLSYKIFDLVFEKQIQSRNPVILFCLFLTVTSPLLFLVKDFDYADLQVAIITLLAIYLFLKTFYSDNIKKNYILIFFSSFLTGAAFGLKYTNISFCIVMLLVVIFFKKKLFSSSIKVFLVVLTAMLSGFLLTDGFWLYTLWHKFHNPIFPYFNDIFHSPYADFIRIIEDDFWAVKPQSLIETVFAPLLSCGLENKYTDIKYYCAFFSYFILFALPFIFKKTPVFKNAMTNVNKLIKPNVLNVIAFFIATVYYINVIIFGGYRYLVSLLCLISIIIAVCLYYLISFQKYIGFKQWLICFSILYAIVMFPNLPDFKMHSVSQTQIIKTQDFKFEDNSNVFMANYLSAYLVPDQNPNAQYIAMALPKKIKQNTIGFNEQSCKNMYYVSDYLEKLNMEKFRENKPTYVVFSGHGLGYEYERPSGRINIDFPMYQEAIKYYSGILLEDLSKCSVFEFDVLGFNNLYPGPLYICKLK